MDIICRYFCFFYNFKLNFLGAINKSEHTTDADMEITCQIARPAIAMNPMANATSRVHQNMDMTCMSDRNMEMSLSEEMDITMGQLQRGVNKSCMDMTCMVTKSSGDKDDDSFLEYLNPPRSAHTADPTPNSTSMEMTCMIPTIEVVKKEDDENEEDVMNTTHFQGGLESSDNIGELLYLYHINHDNILLKNGNTLGSRYSDIPYNETPKSLTRYTD